MAKTLNIFQLRGIVGEFVSLQYIFLTTKTKQSSNKLIKK